jgi:hypothetical protein
VPTDDLIIEQLSHNIIMQPTVIDKQESKLAGQEADAFVAFLAKFDIPN